MGRVMLVAIDIVLAGDPLGLETARDLSLKQRYRATINTNSE